MPLSPLYEIKHNPVRTPAEANHALELENTHLRMRVAVLTEALRAAEEELSKHLLDDCDLAAAGMKRGKA